MSKYLHKSPLSNICTNHSLRYIHSVNISRCTSNSDLAITSFGAMPPHLPDLLPIVCDGQHRPVRRWPLFGRKRPSASWGGGTLRRVQISRFQIDATLTDYFALLRASIRGDSCTSPFVVVVGLILMHRFN